MLIHLLQDKLISLTLIIEKKNRENTTATGDDYQVTDVTYTDAHICEAACAADPRCQAYTYVTRPPLAGSCCLKEGVPPEGTCTTGGVSDCTSGVKPGSKVRATLPLLPTDSEIDLRVANNYLMKHFKDASTEQSTTYRLTCPHE